MEPVKFFQYNTIEQKIHIAMNGKERNFNAQSVDGFQPFVAVYKYTTHVMKWYNSERSCVQISEATKAKLQAYYDKWTDVKSSDKGTCLEDSLMGRLFANGFISAYNYCEQYARKQPSKTFDFTPYIRNLNHANELSVPQTSKLNKDYVLNLGRVEGACFYLVENEYSNPLTVQGNEVRNETTDIQCFTLEQNLRNEEWRPRVIQTIKMIVCGSEDKAVAGYCILAIINLGLSVDKENIKEQDKEKEKVKILNLLKNAFYLDFYPNENRKVFRTSVNRIIRCYRNKDNYYGNDKGEIWGEIREAKYQEIKESIKKAKYNIQK